MSNRKKIVDSPNENLFRKFGMVENERMEQNMIVTGHKSLSKAAPQQSILCSTQVVSKGLTILPQESQITGGNKMETTLKILPILPRESQITGEIKEAARLREVWKRAQQKTQITLTILPREPQITGEKLEKVWKMMKPQEERQPA